MKKVKLTCRDNCKTARRNKIGGSLTEQSVLANYAPLHENTIVNDKLSTNPIKLSVSSELPLNNKKKSDNFSVFHDKSNNSSYFNNTMQGGKEFHSQPFAVKI